MLSGTGRVGAHEGWTEHMTNRWADTDSEATSTPKIIEGMDRGEARNLKEGKEARVSLGTNTNHP